MIESVHSDKKIRWMSDESAAWHRKRLIAAGIIVPSLITYGPGVRPPMDPRLIVALREKLIRLGVLKPATQKYLH